MTEEKITVSRALEIIRKLQLAYKRLDMDEYVETLRIADHAIEDEVYYEDLRTSKEPIPCVINVNNKKTTPAYCCPNCGTTQLSNFTNYCPNCGQAIIWTHDMAKEGYEERRPTNEHC